MVRLIGRDLANKKKIKYALTRIYGVGLSRAEEILERAGLTKNNRHDVRVKDLSDEEISSLRKILERNYRLEGDLFRIRSLSIKRLMENGCLKGRRHRVGLPVRGQRTRTNARTRRGAKKTIPGKKK